MSEDFQDSLRTEARDADDDVLLPEAAQYPLMEARCCRTWPVFAYVPLRRCGYCGEIPTIIGSWETREDPT